MTWVTRTGPGDLDHHPREITMAHSLRPHLPRARPTTPLRRRLGLGLAAVGPGSRLPLASGARPGRRQQATASQPPVDDPGVIANLWEWNWPSVARECTDQLGPAGYGGVQVAPPQDSVKRQHLGDGSDTILHPWWEVYQAVDYALTSRMGDEAAVPGDGLHLPQGRREGLRRRGHQPHDRAGRHVLRRQALHALRLPRRRLDRRRLPPQGRRVPVDHRRHRGLQQQAAGASTASSSGLADLDTGPTRCATGWRRTSTS